MKRKKRHIAWKIVIGVLGVMILAGAVFAAYKFAEKKNEKNLGTADKVQPVADDKLDDFIDGMSLEEKVGQMFMVRLTSLNNGVAPRQINSQQIAMLEKYAVGGVVLFSDNLSTKDVLVQYLKNLQANSKLPLFVGVDEEGGTVSRLGNNGNMGVTKFPNMAEIGASGDASKAYDVGETLGKELKALGVNVNFAPVADVNTNPNNPVIGVRSFGSDADLVASMVAQEVKGLQKQNVSAAVKHFPGHGDTSQDTHTGAVTSNQTMERLKEVEFVPFEAGIDAGVDFVMTAHIKLPNVPETEGLPASLSKEIITNVLRDELKFKKIIITDGMEMQAISDYYTSGDAAVKAIQAGVDIVLLPMNFVDAYDGVIAAVKSGETSEERINESVKRILSVKNTRGLLKL